MGTTNAIYFNSNADLVSTVDALSSYLKLSFVAEKENDINYYKALVFGVEVLISDDHGMEDDGPLCFSNYRFELLFRGWYRHVAGIVEVQKAMAFVSYEILTGMLNWPAMLVEDAQQLVAQFPPRR